MSQDSEPLGQSGDGGDVCPAYPRLGRLARPELLAVSKGWVRDDEGREIAAAMADIVLRDPSAGRRDRIMAARVYAAFRQGDLREEANAIQDRGQTQSAHQRALAALLSSEEGRRILSSLSSIPQLDLSDSVQPVNVTPPVTPQGLEEKAKCPEGGGITPQMDTIAHRDEHGLAPPPARVQAEHKPLGATRRRREGEGGAPPGAQGEDPPG